MTAKQRFLAALQRLPADRLPATTHHVMPYFLDTYLGGISSDEFFERFGLDPIVWTVPHRPEPGSGEYRDPEQGEIGFLESRRVSTDSWRVYPEEIPNPDYRTVRYRFQTPRGTLSMVLQSNDQTAWVADAYGDKALIRGHIPCFDDPGWVRTFLGVLQKRKLVYVRSLKAARYDLLELGGGDASTTVISPAIFREFVAPFDSEIIREARAAGQRISCHTCGGMMPILEDIAAMGTDAMETFTPPSMGGDVDLAEAKRRIGDRVCLIGGFDQFHYLQGCRPEETRRAVRACFEAAGEGGGYVLAASDHFFDAEPELIAAYADEARGCRYPRRDEA